MKEVKLKRRYSGRRGETGWFSPIAQEKFDGIRIKYKILENYYTVCPLQKGLHLIKFLKEVK